MSSVFTWHMEWVTPGAQGEPAKCVKKHIRCSKSKTLSICDQGYEFACISHILNWHSSPLATFTLPSKWSHVFYLCRGGFLWPVHFPAHSAFIKREDSYFELQPVVQHVAFSRCARSVFVISSKTHTDNIQVASGNTKPGFVFRTSLCTLEGIASLLKEWLPQSLRLIEPILCSGSTRVCVAL